MIKIKNTRTIQVVVPNTIINDNTSPYYIGGYTLITNSLNDDEQYLSMFEDVECSVAEISKIEPEFIQLILNDSINNSLDGYAINILNGNKTPYIHIDADLLQEVPSFLEEGDERSLEEYAISFAYNEDETMAWVEIGHYNNGGRSSYTQFDEIKTWAIEYGIETVQIIDKKISE